MTKSPISTTSEILNDLTSLAPRHSPNPLSKLSTTIRSILPRNFHLFNELPTEIRLQIWEASLPDPTVHELYPIYPTPTTHPLHRKARLRSNRRQAPALLHVCREAREVALKHLLIMSYDAPCTPAGTREAVASIAPFYYNPSIDTLFLNCVASIFLDIRWFLLDETPKSIAPIKGWQNIALDSLHMAFVAVVASDVIAPNTPKHRMAELFPDMKVLSVVLDSKGSGKRRLRASLRPGKRSELSAVGGDQIEGLEEIMGYFKKDYGGDDPTGRVEDVDSEVEEDDEKIGEMEEMESATESARPELLLMKVQRKRLYVGFKQCLRYYYVGGRQTLRSCKRKMLGGRRPFYG